MAWYDPTSWDWGTVGKYAALGPVGGALYDPVMGAVTSDPGADAERERKRLLYDQAAASGQFADRAQGSYNQYGARGRGALDALQAQAQGANSVSMEQLRQNLGQMLAQQRSLAAGASPQNAAAAARTAAIQSGRLSSGLAGQQALAGLQERNQAQQQYGQLLGQLRGQDLNAALGGRQTAVTGYGAGNAGDKEKSWLEKYGPAVQGGISAIATKSDRRLKTDMAPGDAQANAAIDKLPPYTYRYRQPDLYGAGRQLGTTTQDLTRAGLDQAVVRMRDGDAVDAGKLAGANTAMIGALGRRVAELERGGAREGVFPTAPSPYPPEWRRGREEYLRAREELLAAEARRRRGPPTPPRYPGDGGSIRGDAGGE